MYVMESVWNEMGQLWGLYRFLEDMRLVDGGRGNSGQVNREVMKVTAILAVNCSHLKEEYEGTSHEYSQILQGDSLLVLYRGCIFRCENCYSEVSELYSQM